jgi:RNA polymerase sigma-70 factor (ECF subfamily)
LKTDYQIIAEVLAGDRNAFSTLVERYQRQVFGLAFRRTGEAALAEDISQDAFIKAFRSLHLFRMESSFLYWISRIALNVVYDRSKNIKNRQEIEFSEDQYCENQTDSPLRVLEDKLKIKRLHTALSSIKSHYADVVTLGILEEKSYHEIGAILSIPTGTVASRMNKAMELLRRKLFGNSRDEEEMA